MLIKDEMIAEGQREHIAKLCITLTEFYIKIITLTASVEKSG